MLIMEANDEIDYLYPMNHDHSQEIILILIHDLDTQFYFL